MTTREGNTQDREDYVDATASVSRLQCRPNGVSAARVGTFNQQSLCVHAPEQIVILQFSHELLRSSFAEIQRSAVVSSLSASIDRRGCR